MIRQAISCDICGTEKRQTNHWFVAIEQGGEMRLTGWNTRNRTRPGTKHLCGQTCLHKLVDEYMARTIAVRGLSTTDESSAAPHHPASEIADNLADNLADNFDDPILEIAEVPTRPAHPAVAPPEPLAPRRVPPRPSAGIVAMPGRAAAPARPEAPRPTPGTWRAEAWNRERDRESRALEHDADVALRRRSGG